MKYFLAAYALHTSSTIQVKVRPREQWMLYHEPSRTSWHVPTVVICPERHGWYLLSNDPIPDCFRYIVLDESEPTGIPEANTFWKEPSVLAQLLEELEHGC